MTRRHALGLCGAVAIVLGTSVIGGPLSGGPAGALGPTCTASNTVTYSPGLLLLEQQVQVTINEGYSNCVTPGRPDITSGTVHSSFSASRSCLQPLDGFSGEHTVAWNTGETSTISGTATVTNVAGQVVFTTRGTVTDGLFAGSSYSEVIAEPALNLLACLAPPGVTGQSGVGAITIL